MLKFHTIKVGKVYPETPFATCVEFDIPELLTAEYQYLQGQHLNCKFKVDGKEIRRSYSLCNAPHENLWRITVKHVDNGQFSTFVREQLEAGDELEVMVPAGRFRTELSPEHQKHYVAFAAGSGITPIMSNLRAILHDEPKSCCTLFYGNKNLKSVLLKEELQDLKNQYMDRLSLHFVFSREKREIDLYSGRLDGNKVETLVTAFCGHVAAIDEVLICGPDTMIKDVAECLQSLGVPKTSVHSERFGVARKSPAIIKSKSMESADAKPRAEVNVIMDGHQRVFHVYGEDNLVDAAAKEGLELPYSCKAGVCSTCRVKLIGGKVDMAVNYALEPWELEQGYVLACQSIPQTDTLSLDYDT